jgi:hypothetical protein
VDFQPPPDIITAAEPLPDLAAVRQRLRVHGRLGIAHPTADEAYQAQLFDALDEYYVYRLPARPELWIQPGASTRAILAVEAPLLAAAGQFRQEATALVHRLAAHLGLATPTLADFAAVKLQQVRTGRRKQPLDAAWTYHLHGHECRFENTVTGQLLEVIIVTAPEFGFLDPYFLLEYLRTTPAYQALPQVLRNVEDAAKALDVLARRGRLLTVEAGGTRRHRALP